MENEYPVADFYSSLEFEWDEVRYEVDKAIKEWIGEDD